MATYSREFIAKHFDKTDVVEKTVNIIAPEKSELALLSNANS